MNRHLKSFALWLTGGYEVYRIFGCEAREPVAPGLEVSSVRPVDRAAIEGSTDQSIRAQAWYAGGQSKVFAYFEQDRIVALCAFWFEDRYPLQDFWPLGTREASLMQVVTVEDCRGRGIARRLIEAATVNMLAAGCSRLVARVWLTNVASVRAFRSAGWKQIAYVATFNPWRLRRPIRLAARLRRT